VISSGTGNLPDLSGYQPDKALLAETKRCVSPSRRCGGKLPQHAAGQAVPPISIESFRLRKAAFEP